MLINRRKLLVGSAAIGAAGSAITLNSAGLFPANRWRSVLYLGDRRMHVVPDNMQITGPSMPGYEARIERERIPRHGLFLEADAATTLAQLDGTSTSWTTVNTTTWAQAVTISIDAVNIAGASPVPVDVMMTFTGTEPASVAAQHAVNVYFSISEDGTHYSDNDQYSGSNNTQTTLRSPTNFLGPWVINTTSSLAYWSTVPSLRAICGGVLPRKFGAIMENQSNVTITGPAASYTLINFTNT